MSTAHGSTPAAHDPRHAPVSPASDTVRARRRVDRFLAVAIGIVTLTAALITYAAVRLESQAGAADSRAASETLVLQSIELFAQTQASTYEGYANQYRVTMAEAQALSRLDGREQLARDSASYLASQSGVNRYLSSPGADATFDRERLHETALHYDDYRTIPRDQPVMTAARAMALHDRARALMQILVALLVVVVVLTSARIVSREAARRALTAFACAAYVGLAVVAVLQIWLPGSAS
jgi:hypothetical protein